ncbi:MAG: MBL fold metallo-hydrolase [Thermomicrobiales bacterium]
MREGQDMRFAPQRVADGITLLDLGFQGQPGAIGAYVVEGNGGLALVETGPTSTRVNLERGLAEIGASLNDVTRLIPTHIHLDHAGAVGSLLRDYPHMRVSLYPTGAPFLTDPERLVKSAGRLYGDAMDRLWGDVVGFDPDRVDLVDDGDRIDLGGRTLLARHTPGHAGNHLSFFDDRTDTLFTGDAAGGRIAPLSWVLPTVSPPEIDFDLWRGTVETLRSLDAARLAVTHFGVFDDVGAHLDQVVANGEDELSAVRQGLATGGSEDEVTAILLDRERAVIAQERGGEDAELLARMELAMPTWLATLGLQRVLKKRGELPGLEQGGEPRGFALRTTGF